MNPTVAALTLACAASLCLAASAGNTPPQTTLPVVSVNLRKATAIENGTGAAGLAAFTILRTGSTSGALTVGFTLGGTATKDQDYSAPGTTVTIPPGADRVTVVIKAIDDQDAEGDETVILTLAAASGYQIGTPATRTVTLQDDEDAGTDPTLAPVGS